MKIQIMLLFFCSCLFISTFSSEDCKSVEVIVPIFNKCGFLSELKFLETDDKDLANYENDNAKFVLKKTEFLKKITYKELKNHENDEIWIVGISFTTNNDRTSTFSNYSEKTANICEYNGFIENEQILRAQRGNEIYAIKGVNQVPGRISYIEYRERTVDYGFVFGCLSAEWENKSKSDEASRKKLERELKDLKTEMKEMKNRHKNSNLSTLKDIGKMEDPTYDSKAAENNLLSSINHMLAHPFDTTENFISYVLDERKRILNNPAHPSYSNFISKKFGGSLSDDEIIKKTKKHYHATLNLIANIVHHDIYLYEFDNKEHIPLLDKFLCLTEKHSYDIHLISKQPYFGKMKFMPTTRILKNKDDLRAAAQEKIHQKIEAILMHTVKHSGSLKVKDSMELGKFLNGKNLETLLKQVPGIKRKHVNESEAKTLFFKSLNEQLNSLPVQFAGLSIPNTRKIIKEKIEQLLGTDSSDLNRHDEHIHHLLTKYQNTKRDSSIEQIQNMIDENSWEYDETMFDVVTHILAGHYEVNIIFYDNFNKEIKEKSLFLHHKRNVKLVYDGHHYHNFDESDDEDEENNESTYTSLRNKMDDCVEKQSQQMISNVLNKLPLDSSTKDAIMSKTGALEEKAREKIDAMEDAMAEHIKEKAKEMAGEELKAIEKGLFNSCCKNSKPKMKLPHGMDHNSLTVHKEKIHKK